MYSFIMCIYIYIKIPERTGRLHDFEYYCCRLLPMSRACDTLYLHGILVRDGVCTVVSV